MSEPTLKLQRNAEELLREFPIAEPDFEAQALAIEARLKGSPGGVVFDDLLKVPELAAEQSEPAAPSSTRTASAPKSNFAEMARKSMQPKDDSAELTKELLAATAHSRRPNAEMVERVRAAGRVASTSTPLPVSEPVPEEAARLSGVVARAATTVRPAAAAPSNHRGVVIGVIGGALALAACVALFVRGSGEDERTSAALAAQKAADAPAAVVAAGAKPGTPSPAATNDGVLSPEALAATPAALQDDAKPGVAKAGGGAVAGAAAPASKAAPGTSAQPQQLAVVLEDDLQPAEPPPAAPKAEPVTEPALKPAEGNSGSVPLNPSAGAVSAALSSVRSGAQACLAGQTEPATAVVTFAADGHVLRVSAGGPASACIKAALSKAQIAPFAKDSFSATTTIRPP